LAATQGSYARCIQAQKNKIDAIDGRNKVQLSDDTKLADNAKLKKLRGEIEDYERIIPTLGQDTSTWVIASRGPASAWGIDQNNNQMDWAIAPLLKDLPNPNVISLGNIAQANRVTNI
jgi:hypothetical protein